MRDISTFRLRVEADDTISWFNPEWERFALENGAAHLPDCVLHRPIWKFISGSTVTQIYQNLFLQVRASRNPVTVLLRCDSPSLKRQLELTIATPDGACLELTSTFLKVEPRPYLDILDSAAPRAELILGMCAWCKKIRLPSGEWTEIESAVKILGLLEEEAQPGLSHTMCKDCMKLYIP